jgi:5-methylcytosine-specific restriction endonuclease McrA
VVAHGWRYASTSSPASPYALSARVRGRIQIATEVDHIKALKDGGDNTFGNLRGLCVDHHLAKTRADRGLAPKVKVTYGADGWPKG